MNVQVPQLALAVQGIDISSLRQLHLGNVSIYRFNFAAETPAYCTQCRDIRRLKEPIRSLR